MSSIQQQPTTDKKSGFTETLKPSENQAKELSKLDKNICQNIFINGSKVNKKYFYPSEFPKLTKIKPITVSNKKGGSKRKRKSLKKRKFMVNVTE
jgi:hypothetical protein